MDGYDLPLTEEMLQKARNNCLKGTPILQLIQLPEYVWRDAARTMRDYDFDDPYDDDCLAEPGYLGWREEVAFMRDETLKYIEAELHRRALRLTYTLRDAAMVSLADWHRTIWPGRSRNMCFTPGDAKRLCRYHAGRWSRLTLRKQVSYVTQ